MCTIHTTHSRPPTRLVQRPLVNWDVVNTKWDHLTERVRAERTRLAS